MDRREYQAAAMRTAPNIGKVEMRLNAMMGLVGESGEVVDCLKKWRFQSGENYPLPVDTLVKEIGDVYWYCALMAQACGFSLGDVPVWDVREPDTVKDPKDYLCDIALQIAANCSDMQEYKHGKDVMRNLETIMTMCGDILAMAGSDESRAMERNVTKLKLRYPEGFDPMRSLHRTEQE